MNSDFTCRYVNTTRAKLHPEASALQLHEEMRSMVQMRSGPYLAPLHSIRLPFDPSIVIEAKQFAERYYTSRLKYIVIIGIGGSNLGTQAIYEALRGKLDLSTKNLPKVLFLDTISALYVHDLEEMLVNEIQTSDEILINIVSKSGTTTESVANFEFLLEGIAKHIPDIHSRIVVTTDHGSPLWIAAHERGYGQLAIPAAIGGRFSVFTLVGLFPLLLAGVDVVELLKGAQYLTEKNFDNNKDDDHARHNAEILFGEMQKGITMLNIFHFHPELESLGKWERQLIGESLGKEHDRSGKKMRMGITPIVSIGSTDLHSMAQLYFGGPRDKFTMLVKAFMPSSRRIPKNLHLGDIIPGIAGRGPDDIMNAIYGGVVGAYRKLDLPYAEVPLSSLSEFSLGAYMQWRMLSTIYLAELMNVNAFDQPAVEHYKEGTRRLLGGGK